MTFAVPASLTLSPSARSRTSPKVTSFPGSPSRVATVRIAPSSTRYCFPPVRTTAYTVWDHPYRKSRRVSPTRRRGSIPDGRPPTAHPARDLGGRGGHLHRATGGTEAPLERRDPEQRGESHDRRGVRDRMLE